MEVTSKLKLYAQAVEREGKKCLGRGKSILQRSRLRKTMSWGTVDSSKELEKRVCSE